MGRDRNGQECQHHDIKYDPETDEEYCAECGDVIEVSEPEDE